jgi:hypothetical protein
MEEDGERGRGREGWRGREGKRRREWRRGGEVINSLLDPLFKGSR